MKVLKWTLIAVAGIIIAAIASTFFMHDSFRVAHKQTIKASPEAVYNQLATPKNWEKWSYWHTLDDKMELSYNDIPTGIGASYSWKSDKKDVGNGKLTITDANPNYILCKLDFEGFDDGGISEYVIKQVEGGTELESAMTSPSKGIIEKLMTRFMMKPMMKKAIKASADKMDAYLQANPDANKTTTSVDSVSAK